MTFHPLDWVWAAVTLGAVVFWGIVLRRCLGGHDGLHTEPSRILTIATITIVCVLSLILSLLYADIITVESSRWLINSSRIALLLGGFAVWWVGRREGVR